jgi:hypothetical protein
MRSLLTEASAALCRSTRPTGLGAWVRNEKIVFFGLFRTEEDALEAVT